MTKTLKPDTAAAAAAKSAASAALERTRGYRQNVESRRNDAQTALATARLDARAAGEALAEGGDEKAFKGATERVAIEEARMRALEGLISPALDAERDAEQHLAEVIEADADLQFRARLLSHVLIADEAAARALQAVAIHLQECRVARERVQGEFPRQFAAMFRDGAAGSSHWTCLIRTAPPELRALIRPIYEAIMGPMIEAPNFAHDPEALSAFATSVLATGR